MLLMTKDEKTALEQLAAGFRDWVDINISQVTGGYIITITRRYTDDEGVVIGTSQDRVVTHRSDEIGDIIDHMVNAAPKPVQ